MQLAFLMRHETILRDDPVFYDFVPYRYGPFSFTLYRELERLHKDGLVTKADEGLILNAQMMTTIRERISELPGVVQSAIGLVVRTHGSTAIHDLLKDVYTRYPWYATRSQRADLRPRNLPWRKPAEPAVYTAGYQSKSVDGFFNDLLRFGIQLIVDVRANPVSRKYGFARSSMSGIAAKLGMEYLHLPRLGIPSNKRAGLGSTASYERLLTWYESEMLSDRKTDVNELAQLMRKKPSVLVCMEQDARCCHRSRLATSVSQISSLPVSHLG